MICSSSLIDISEPLVLDTSVLINLHACKHGERILAAIPNNIVITDVVAGELEQQTSGGNGECSFLKSLFADGFAALEKLTDTEYKLFQTLVSTSPSLDDGEAATIAVAVTRNLLPIVDERKGRSRAEGLMRTGLPGWSLDLFCHPATFASLGNHAAVEALYFSLRDSRMRIPLESTDSVIELIGMERSRDCICLPGYRERFSSAHKEVATEMRDHQKQC
jgi:predicted nucleic acid-binding protein